MIAILASLCMLSTRPLTPEPVEERWIEAVDVATGETLWQQRAHDESVRLTSDRDHVCAKARSTSRCWTVDGQSIPATACASGAGRNPTSPWRSQATHDRRARPIGTRWGLPVDRGRIELPARPGRAYVLDGRLITQLQGDTNDRELLAFDARTGELAWQWRFPATEQGRCAGAVDYRAVGGLLLASDPQAIARIDPKTGATLWVHQAPDDRRASLRAFTKGETVVLQRNHSLYGLDIATGRRQWVRHRGPLRGQAVPVHRDGRLFFDVVRVDDAVPPSPPPQAWWGGYDAVRVVAGDEGWSLAPGDACAAPGEQAIVGPLRPGDGGLVLEQRTEHGAVTRVSLGRAADAGDVWVKRVGRLHRARLLDGRRELAVLRGVELQTVGERLLHLARRPWGPWPVALLVLWLLTTQALMVDEGRWYRREREALATRPPARTPAEREALDRRIEALQPEARRWARVQLAVGALAVGCAVALLLPPLGWAVGSVAGLRMALASRRRWAGFAAWLPTLYAEDEHAPDVEQLLRVRPAPVEYTGGGELSLAVAGDGGELSMVGDDGGLSFADGGELSVVEGGELGGVDEAPMHEA